METAKPPRGLWARAAVGLVPCVGAMAGLQAALNAHLGARAGSGALAALVCYSITFVLLLLVAAIHARHSGRRFCRLRPGATFVWYEWLGGMAGALGQLLTIYLTPLLGVAMLFALIVAGQLSSSMILDHKGFLGLQQSSVTLGKAIALLVALAGVAAGASAGMADAAATSAEAAPSVLPTYAYVLSCIAVWVGGCASPVQAVMNWRLGKVLPHKLQAILVSVTVAGSIAAVITVALALAGPPPGQHAPAAGGASFMELAGNLRHAEWWSFLGSLCMLATLTGGAVFPAKIGAAPYYTLLLLGELASSLVLDATGACGLPVRRASAARIISVLLVAVGSLTMKYASRVDSMLARVSGWLPGGGACMPVPACCRCKRAASMPAYASIATSLSSLRDEHVHVGYNASVAHAALGDTKTGISARQASADRLNGIGDSDATVQPSPAWRTESGDAWQLDHHHRHHHHHRGQLSLCNSFMGVGALLAPGPADDEAEISGMERGDGEGEAARGSCPGGHDADHARCQHGCECGLEHNRRHTETLVRSAGDGSARVAECKYATDARLAFVGNARVEDDGYRRRLLSGSATTPLRGVAPSGASVHGAGEVTMGATRAAGFGFIPGRS
jgi:transporter family-2 protein